MGNEKFTEQENYLQIGPVNPGWRAVFADGRAGEIKLTALPLIGLALEEKRTIRRSDKKVTSLDNRIKGLVCSKEGEILTPEWLEEHFEFIGYAAPGQDLEEFRAEAEERFQRIEARYQNRN